MSLEHDVPPALCERAARAELAVFLEDGLPVHTTPLLNRWLEVVDRIGSRRFMDVEWESVLSVSRGRLDRLLAAAEAQNSGDLLCWLLPRVEVIDEAFRAKSSFDPEACGWSQRSLHPSMWWLRRQPHDPGLGDRWRGLSPLGLPVAPRQHFAAEALTDAVPERFLGDCSGIDLAGEDLSGIDMTGALLQNANFDGANLDGALLVGARLSGASFRGAHMEAVDLRIAVARRIDATGADLNNALLDGADLAGATLARTDLAEATMSHAHLPWVDLSEASVVNIVMERAALTNADLRGADLTGTRLPDRKAMLFTRTEGATFSEPAPDTRQHVGLKQYGEWFHPDATERGLPALDGASDLSEELPAAYVALLSIGSLDYLNDRFDGSLTFPVLDSAMGNVLIGSLDGLDLMVSTGEHDPAVVQMSGVDQRVLSPSLTRFVATRIAPYPPSSLV